MGDKQQTALAAGVREVHDRIEHWRRTREKRTAMPEDLWNAAVSVARVHGAYRASRMLRVNYESLKGRLQLSAARPGDGETRPGGFVELSAEQLVGAAGHPATVVELSDVDGARLTIRLGGSEGLDVVGLANAFWSRRA